MKLKVKRLNISTQGHNVCLINSEEAKELHIKNFDRLSIKKGTKEIFAVVDINHTHHFIKKGEIGLFDETYEEITSKSSRKPLYVDINVAQRPFSLNLIEKKLNGIKLSDSEIYSIVSETMSSKLSEVEIAHFISGCYSSGLSDVEIISLTNSFLNTGNIIKFDRYPLVNLSFSGAYSHSILYLIASVISSLRIGFVCDLDSDPLIPGNSRSIFNAFGMLYNSVEDSEKSLKKVSSCFILGKENLTSPVSYKLDSIEHPFSIFSDGLYVASSLSRSKSVSPSNSFVCLIYGPGRKIKDINHAKKLKKLFEKISGKVRMKSHIILVDGSFIWERSFGPSNEASDIINALKMEESLSDLRNMAINIAGEILTALGKRNGKRLASEIICSGQAYSQFRKILASNSSKYSESKFDTYDSSHISGLKSFDIKSHKTGFVSNIDGLNLIKCALISGASSNLVSGIRWHKNRHDRVALGEKIITITSSSESSINSVRDFIKNNSVIHIT